MGAAARVLIASLALLLLLHATAEDDKALFFYVESPESLAYSFQIQPALQLGTPFPDRPSRGVELIYSYPSDACKPLKNLIVYGKVVLAERGDCSFVEKALHAEQAGARALIVTNSAANDHENVDMVPDTSERRAGIPVAYLIGVSGRHLRDYLIYGNEDVYITIPLNHSTISLKDIPQKPPWELW